MNIRTRIGKMLQRRNTVAQCRRALELKLLCRRLHLSAQGLPRLLDVAAQHPLSAPDELAVALGGYFICARCRTSAHIKVDAGSLLSYIARKGSLAGRQ